MMKKLLISFSIVMAYMIPVYATNSPDTNENTVVSIVDTASLRDFFAEANLFMQKNVQNGLVDYNAIKNEGTQIKKLYTTIGLVDLSKADKNTITAFYLNAYNIITIQSVISHMPIAKPTDVKGFFDATKHTVAGVNLTLNEIENNKLRPDPRVHFALVCAAKGCPKLAAEAFMPDKVENQLNTLTKKAINDKTFIRVNHDAKTVQISKIFDWYGVDFIKHSGSVLSYINTIRTEKIPQDYAVVFYAYDWNLNIK